MRHVFLDAMSIDVISQFEWDMFYWTPCLLHLFTIWVGHVFLDNLCIAPFHYLSGTCFLGHHVYCAFSLFEWDMFSWTPCILCLFTIWVRHVLLDTMYIAPLHYLSGKCFLGLHVYCAFSLFKWDMFSWIPCILRLFTIWVGHVFLDNMYIAFLHYLSGKYFLGRHVYCASSLLDWNMFSWTPCILRLFIIWVGHDFLDMYSWTPCILTLLHYLSGKCFLENHVYCASSLFERGMFF